MPENQTQQTRVSNFFTNENPDQATNSSGTYGIISDAIDPTLISDGLTERGAGLGKLGSSMPSPMARLFLFSAALREVNSIEAGNAGEGHVGVPNEDGKLEPTPYHDLVGELLDMLEFIFKYGDEPDFKVQLWDLGIQCDALDNSKVQSHKNLASALRSAFEFNELKGHSIYLFKWKDKVIGGTSPISLVYTSANLRTVLNQSKFEFTGNASNILFADKAIPLHKRDRAFKEYLYRLRYTDLQAVGANRPLYQLSKYIQDSATNYDADIDNEVRPAPAAYKNVKNLQTEGLNVRVAGVQLRVSDHTIIINPSTSDYILAPTVDYYKHGDQNVQTPLILTKNGDDTLIYAAGRNWNADSDKIAPYLLEDIYDRHLPGFGQQVKYPFLTVNDFFEDKVIEVSYAINSKKFFTGSAKDINGRERDIAFLLPIKKIFFDYFSMEDLFDDNGQYTDMLTVVYDEEHENLTVTLNIPLVNGNNICLEKTYSTAANSVEKLDCYDGANTFDFAVFPFYRLEPNLEHNVYNVMVGSTIKNVSFKFFEPSADATRNHVRSEARPRTRKSKDTPLSTEHIRVNGAFSVIEITVPDADKKIHALAIPIFKKVNSDPALAPSKFTFSIDFGTTNTHVSYVRAMPGQPFGHDQVLAFDYDESSDAQMVMFNDNGGVREFGAFATAIKREFVPDTIGGTIKFPMRTATYQVPGQPNVLEMFFNTNIGFNYGEDISRSSDYKTNIKWDRFDGNANERMSTFFAQMLWMMKNKSVLNEGSDSFKLVVTHPISMRTNDLENFKNAWENAMNEVQCDVDIRYRTESVAPYYSYLATLGYGEPYANMDIGGGTTDILYVNPFSGEAHVFSAFFAANDLWNDGIDLVNRALKANGFVKYYTSVQGKLLGDKKADVDAVINKASSSADIISYLFANDSWSKLSNTIRRSTKIMQLPVIHFSALAFYMAYALHMAEVEIPRNLSFTGMGSKYIKLISGAELDISRLVNAIFHYAGLIFKNPKLQEAAVSVSFADNPKEVTATGALISLNYNNAINPDEDTYYGFEEEDPGKTLRYQNITGDVQDSVVRLFKKFTALFQHEEVLDVLSDLGYCVDANITSKLSQYATQSLRQMTDCSAAGQNPTDKLKEPMFFWPLKNSLYVIGKDLSKEAADEVNRSKTN
jgi:hypothetical protein